MLLLQSPTHTHAPRYKTISTQRGCFHHTREINQMLVALNAAHNLQQTEHYLLFMTPTRPIQKLQQIDLYLSSLHDAGKSHTKNQQIEHYLSSLHDAGKSHTKQANSLSSNIRKSITTLNIQHQVQRINYLHTNPTTQYLIHQSRHRFHTILTLSPLGGTFTSAHTHTKRYYFHLTTPLFTTTNNIQQNNTVSTRYQACLQHAETVSRTAESVISHTSYLYLPHLNTVSTQAHTERHCFHKQCRRLHNTYPTSHTQRGYAVLPMLAASIDISTRRRARFQCTESASTTDQSVH